MSDEIDTKVKLAIYRSTAGTAAEIKNRQPGGEETMDFFASIGLTVSFWDPKSDRWG